MKFILASMNLIDFFAVIPYFSLILINNQKSALLGIFRTLRFVRVVRLFRFSKHSRRLKVVAIILRSSFSDLRLLMLCLVIIIFCLKLQRQIRSLSHRTIRKHSMTAVHLILTGLLDGTSNAINLA